MVVYPLSAVETGRPCLLDDGLEVPVVCVAQRLGKISAGPELHAGRAYAANALESGDVVVHALRSQMSSRWPAGADVGAGGGAVGKFSTFRL